MRNKFNPKTEPNKPTVYKIRIKGHLSPQWRHWFEGLTVTLENGDTLLSGPVADQAALHGLLKKVRDLGIPLVSVSQVQFDETHSKKERKMNKSKLIWGIICLVIAGVLTVAYLTLPPENLMFQLGAVNMPWIPPVVLGIIGIILLATVNKVEAEPVKVEGSIHLAHAQRGRRSKDDPSAPFGSP